VTGADVGSTVPRAFLLAAMLLSAGVVTADEYAGWRYWKAIRLDTTAAGAGVKRDVRGFPVPVVLGAGFDFGQAKPDGTDVRFSRTMDGNTLPHAIDHWDAARRSAVLWVRLDLVKGDDASQSFVMYWGNPAAGTAGDAKAVFDTKDGFVGVWHLGEDGDSKDGGYHDATANEAHMTGVNMTPGDRGDGRLGRGVRLQHARRQWLKIESDKRRLFDLTTRATFSVWAKAHGYFNRGEKGKALPGYETMFAKGDNSWRLQKFGIREWHKPPADLVEICVEEPPRGDLCVVGKTDMAVGHWYHFVGVHDYPRARLYVNGVLEAEETFDVNWISGDWPVGLGNQSQFPTQGRFWDGVLDEARVLKVPKDEDWIKLDYESQREGSKLLSFGETHER
jgi:Concanavalin A-like lectin/glucanases superfamily/Domain of unknown function (DUF2341)